MNNEMENWVQDVSNDLSSNNFQVFTFLSVTASYIHAILQVLSINCPK